jgi:penicillin-binding protein 1C
LNRRIEKPFKWMLAGTTIAVVGMSIWLMVVVIKTSELTIPYPTLVVIDGNGGFITEIRDGTNNIEAGYWPVEPVPPRIAATVKAIEDRRFDWHPGVDPVAVSRAIVQNIRNKSRISGASTLAMQTARLERPSKRNYRNKLREMITAAVITSRYGRLGVMDHYLRLAPYGNGIRGIGYAAYCYFGKPVEDLSWAEIAFLSAIPQQPNRMNPRTGFGRTRLVSRARRIIRRVHEEGHMSGAEAKRALEQVADLMIQPRLTQPPEAIHLALRYRNMLNDESFRKQCHVTVVKTDIDPEIQKDVLNQTRLCVTAWEKAGVKNAAVMVLNARTGAVIALIGSTDYYDTERAGAIDYSRVKRSPGSTLKPFIYALAMESGIICADSILFDRVSHAQGFRNFDGIWLGEIEVDRALASSRNVPAVDLLRQTGVHQTYGRLADLGLHGYETDAQRYGLGLAVGGLPVTMEALVRAFDVFSAGGVLRDIQWYRGQSKAPAERIFSVRTVQWINRSLSDPMVRLPSFPRMGHLEYEYPAAAKTGTSDGARDAWTVAWSPEYLVAVWLGRPDGKPMNRVGGYRTAAELARVVMDRLHDKEKMPTQKGWAAEPLRKKTLEHNRNQSGIDRIDLWSPKSGSVASIEPETILITSPEHNATYYFDPDIPVEFSSVLLAVNTNIRSGEITWEINGIPYVSTTEPFTTRWQLRPGVHNIRAVSPSKGVSSPVVTINVSSGYSTGI